MADERKSKPMPRYVLLSGAAILTVIVGALTTLLVLIYAPASSCKALRRLDATLVIDITSKRNDRT